VGNALFSEDDSFQSIIALLGTFLIRYIICMSVSVRTCLTPTWAAQLIGKSMKLKSFCGVGVHRISLPSIILHICASRASIQLAPESCVSAQLRRAAQIPTRQYALLHRFMSCPPLCHNGLDIFNRVFRPQTASPPYAISPAEK
jgi:hypothetical protein